MTRRNGRRSSDKQPTASKELLRCLRGRIPPGETAQGALSHRSGSECVPTTATNSKSYTAAGARGTTTGANSFRDTGAEEGHVGRQPAKFPPKRPQPEIAAGPQPAKLHPSFWCQAVKNTPSTRNVTTHQADDSNKYSTTRKVTARTGADRSRNPKSLYTTSPPPFAAPTRKSL